MLIGNNRGYDVTVNSDPWFQSYTVGFRTVHIYVFVIADCSWSRWDNGAIFNVQRRGDRVGCSLLKTLGLQECRRITNIYCNESF